MRAVETKGRIKAMEDKMGIIQQQLQSLAAGGSSAGVSGSSAWPGGHNRRAMEHRAINGLKVQGSDRAAFRMWHEKLVNSFSLVEQGYRAMLSKLALQVDQHERVDVVDAAARSKWLYDNLPSVTIDMERLNDDMYTV